MGLTIRKELQFNLNKKFILTCSARSKNDVTQSVQDKVGLVFSHAYSIIGIYEVVHPKLGAKKLIKIRNPW